MSIPYSYLALTSPKIHFEKIVIFINIQISVVSKECADDRFYDHFFRKNSVILQYRLQLMIIILIMKISILLLLVALAIAREYPLFNQCDPKWANQKIGSSSNTICKAGDLISSIAMGLAGIGQNQNPSTLNTWLKSHKGYDSKNNLVWNALNPLGVTFQGQVSNVILKLNIDVGYLVIINVNKGAHWALATSYTGNTIFVKDSLHPEKTSYDMSQIVSGHNAVYKVPNTIPISMIDRYDQILRMRRNRNLQHLTKYE